MNHVTMVFAMTFEPFVPDGGNPVWHTVHFPPEAVVFCSCGWGWSTVIDGRYNDAEDVALGAVKVMAVDHVEEAARD